LEEHASGLERHFHVLLRGLLPVEDVLDVIGLDVEVVTVTEGGLKKHTDREGQSVQTLVVKTLHVEELVGFVADLEVLLQVSEGSR
jgi:hypothetical protein